MVDSVALPVGVGVALVTMFDGDSPDATATAERAQACVARGVSSVLVAGTTGEAARLDARARLLLVQAVKDAVGDVPVIVGTGHPSGEVALETTAKVAAAGVADALLVYVPEELDAVAFYARVRDEAGSVPLLAYHNPAIPSRSLETALIPTLDVDGVKDSSGSSNRLAELLALGMRVYVGSPTHLVVAGACGAAGALLAVANVAPRECVAAWHGDLDAQRALFDVHLRAVGDFPRYLKETGPGEGAPLGAVDLAEALPSS